MSSRSGDSKSPSGGSKPGSDGSSLDLYSALDAEARAMREKLSSIDDIMLPAQRAPGKAGRKIALRSNYYRVKINPNEKIFQLDVNIKEDNAILGKESVKKTDEKRAFMIAFLKEKFPTIHNQVAYDGQSSLYFRETMGLMIAENEDAGKTMRFQYAPRGPRKRDFSVTLRRVNYFNSNDINRYLNGDTLELRMDAIQALDIVFRHRASNDVVNVGRSFFPANQPNRKDIGGGREVWFGYHQSLKAIDGKSGGTLALNIDAAAKAFVKEQLGHEIAMEVFRPRGGEREMADHRFWSDSRRKTLEKYISKLNFIPMHLKNRDRNFRCSTLSRNGADRQTFIDDNGRSINIADYYFKQYKIKLRFPSAPMIQVGTGKNIKYFPLELMRVAPRQPHRGQVDENMQSNMIRAIADPAPKKEGIIDQMAKRAISELSPMAALYGVQTSAKMEEISGRVLDAPQMAYGNKKTVKAYQGAWDARREKFFDAKSFPKWVVIAYQARMDQRQVNDFANGLCKAASFEGMRANPPDRVLIAQNENDLMRYYEGCKNNGVTFALVILPRRDSHIYSIVKEKAELVFGVVTQCVQSRNVERANAMFYGNLLQKINVKLGGVNTKVVNRIQLFTKPIMIVGLSFSHPAPGSRNPSIVTASFSCDASGTKYFVGKRLQSSRFSLATGIKDLFLEGLKGFYKRANGKKPERIIVYRNGASEGELQAVAKLEVGQMKAAFAALPGNYSPKLTVIVVNKRTHTRMFAQDKADQIGKSGNVPSGTVVDTVVTSKGLCDWYLNSSQGIQGTSRPVHYTLLHDENNLDADNLQMMSFHLCHAYARCTRTVSLPIPCLYAELMGDRVARYLQSRGIGSDAGSVSSMESGDSDFEKLSLDIKTEIGDMFFV